MLSFASLQFGDEEASALTNARHQLARQRQEQRRSFSFWNRCAMLGEVSEFWIHNE